MAQRMRRGGFSLMELIASIVVLGVAMPPTLIAIRDAQVSRASPVQLSTARWLATERLEEIIADRHSASRGWAYLIGANYPAEAPVSGHIGFSRQVALAETGPDLATPGDGYLTVTVTVSWSGAKGGRQVSVATVLTEY